MNLATLTCWGYGCILNIDLSKFLATLWLCVVHFVFCLSLPAHVFRKELCALQAIFAQKIDYII